MGQYATSISSDIDSCKACTPTQTLATLAAGTTAQSITATDTYFRRATLLAFKTQGGGANTGDIKLGAANTYANLPMTLAPGDEISIEAPLGAKWSLKDWYFGGTIGDGLVVIYS
jgi:hypothetical protein